MKTIVTTVFYANIAVFFGFLFGLCGATAFLSYQFIMWMADKVI